jgi:hypothetical protein
MPTNGPTGLGYGLGLIGGTLLFFSLFGAVLVGSRGLLLALLLCYAAAGAIGARAGSMTPTTTSLILAAPAVPWVLWLFPASAAESGVMRALLWPGLALLGAGLGWIGGTVALAVRARRGRTS